MAKRITYRLVLAVFLVGLLYGCTPSVQRTKKLLNKGRWIFTQLDIGANEVTLYPKWDIKESPNDKEFAQATWTHYDGSTCLFKWRFDYYEGTFSFMVDYSVTQDESAKAYIQCQNLTGSYAIITEKNKLFEFESTTTTGYPGVPVFIQIQPI